MPLLDVMNKKRAAKFRNQIAVLILFLVLCMILAVFCFQYYTRLHKTIHEESKTYLHEVTMRIGSNIDRIINDNYAVLYTMAENVESMDNMSMEGIRGILKKQQKHWDYQNLLLIDKSGKTYDLEDKEVFQVMDSSVSDDITSGRRSMSTEQIIGNKEYVIFTVPLNNIEVEGRTLVALAGAYDPSALDEVLSMTSFDNQAYSQIILKNGTVVTRPSSPYAFKTGYNVFSSLQNVSMEESNSLGKMKEDILNDIAGQIRFTENEMERYLVYTPIQPDEWYLMTFVPVQAVNARSDMLLKVTVLICGLVTVTFAGMLVTILLIFRRNKRKLEQAAYVDEVTGGHTVQKFYLLSRTLLDTNLEIPYALVFTNLEKFKILNEQLGRQNCDMMLRQFSAHITSVITDKECIGRIAADNFCILMEYEDRETLLKRFENWYCDALERLKEKKVLWDIPVTEFGVYVIENRSLAFPLMIDRAKLALRDSRAAADGRIRYGFYDDDLRKQLFREKQLEDKMRPAMENHEFQVYLQPKYLVQEEQIGGAEALVRWQCGDEGMIYPNEFIPLFESNGFIVSLDLFVFEEVCKLTRKWLDQGLEPVAISVNCSRVHLRDRAFLAPYIKIARQYRIPEGLLEIELTEGIVLEDSERWLGVIRQIQDAGFACSMDDFGSGYSSLNLIQSIPVNTLKLDKIFFQSGPQELERTEAVVGNIVRMAKALNMKTVAEGVEYREQVEMLKKVDCDLIQGYVFAKPMKITAFEELAFGRIIECNKREEL